MGMAASQARFLGLTARKTNVEFEGQQINQQRTTLSNQSANYYNNLLGMAVPVPPSVDNFTKTVYSFEDGALTNSITALMSQGGGNYKVSYLKQYVDEFAPVAATTSILTDNGNGTYSVGATELRQLGNQFSDPAPSINDMSNTQIGPNSTDTVGAALPPANFAGLGGTYSVPSNDPNYDARLAGKTQDEATKLYYMYDQNDVYRLQAGDKGYDPRFKGLTRTEVDALAQEEVSFATALAQKYGGSTSDWLVRYAQNTTTGEMVPYFYRKQEVENAQYDSNGHSQSNIACYTMGKDTKIEEIKNVNAKVEQDSTGRLINITLYSDDACTQNPVTYALTTNTVTDQDAYNDAMNQYEYNKYEYDQAIQNINAKISIIQSQDKNLELRMKQLDTEQNAIQTEMDAVSKVIQKNVESTFKTFG